MNHLNLTDKVTLITGAGTGLGKAMALAVAKSGGSVVLAGRRNLPIEEVADQIGKIGTPCIPIPTDVTDSKQVNILVQKSINHFGQVDALINNAGMVRDQGGVPIWEISDEDWESVINSNLTSAFYCSRAVAEDMAKRGSGKIINVSSGFGLRGGTHNYMYASSKGGVIQLTRSLATSLGRFGLTSNCIVPGFFPTEGTSLSKERLPDPKFIPINRVGKPEEIGNLATFLISEESDYMNGELFVIDGGGLAGGYAPTGYGPLINLENPPKLFNHYIHD